MLTVNNYKVTFVHSNIPTETSNGDTICKIYNTETKEIVSRGIAYVSKKDSYNKNTGRKVSMAKALKNLSLSKEDRQLFWNEYFSRHGKIN